VISLATRRRRRRRCLCVVGRVPTSAEFSRSDVNRQAGHLAARLTAHRNQTPAPLPPLWGRACIEGSLLRFGHTAA